MDLPGGHQRAQPLQPQGASRVWKVPDPCEARPSHFPVRSPSPLQVGQVRQVQVPVSAVPPWIPCCRFLIGVSPTTAAVQARKALTSPRSVRKKRQKGIWI